MDPFFLGLDSLDEAVAPSLGLDIHRGVRTVNAQYYGIRLTLRSATTYSQEPGPILFSFSETFIRSGTFSQVGENVIPDMSVGATRPTSLSCSSLRDAIYTLAPFCTYAEAIIVPMPDPPPVTTAVHFVKLLRERFCTKFPYAPIFPLTLKRLGIVKSRRTRWSKETEGRVLD
jgi:hypothetical protein